MKDMGDTVDTDTMHIGDLKHDPQNARRRTERGLGMIEQSLSRNGAGRSILLDEHDTILAGNGVIDAAAAAGIERVRVIEADGDEIIAVRRSNLTSEQKTEMALFDNRTAELAEWNVDVLAGLNEEGDLDQFWFPQELAQVLAANDESLDLDAEWQGMPEYEQEDRSAVKQITVSFMRADDVDTFAQTIGQTVTMSTKGITFPLDRARFHESAYVTDGSGDES